MSEKGPSRQTDLGRQVRAALSHLYDIPYLQRLPLATALQDLRDNRGSPGAFLHKRLVDAIDGLKPAAAGPTDPRALRRHQLATLRYLEAMEIDDVCSMLSISRAEYYRELRQALDAIVDAVASLMQDTTPEVAGNLPAPLTRLIGRDSTVEELTARIASPGCRLLTLTGPGGIGKTRLALEIARSLVPQFCDGAFFVDLAPVTTRAEVASAIAATLGMLPRSPAQGDGQTAPNRPPEEALKQRLRDAAMLLVLDNFEQALAAGPLVADLLVHAPQVKVLATSRASLRLRGEHVAEVPPLPCPEGAPPAAGLDRYPAFALFIERARAGTPGLALTPDDPALIAEICRRLDGLPLAIELAAARLGVLTPRALLHRLDRPLHLLVAGAQDSPSRQQTLRATLDWSYDLLSATEQALFRRLGVFAGGFTLPAVQALNGGGDPLNDLAGLLHSSLLRQERAPDGQPRFLMLETVRQYAFERLQQTGEEPTIRQAHAGYYLDVAEAAAPCLDGPAQNRWLELLDREIDNLRSVLRWYIEARDTVAAQRLGIALRGFWIMRGHVAEGREWLDQLLDMPGQAGNGLRSRCLRAAASLAAHQADNDRAIAFDEESLALAQQLEDRAGVAAALNGLGYVALSRGDYDTAETLITRALAHRRDLNDRTGVAACLTGLGRISVSRSAYPEARVCFNERLAIARDLGDNAGIATALRWLGRCAQLEGDPVTARALYQEALALSRALGHKPDTAYSLRVVGSLAQQAGHYSEAREALDEALTLAGDLGNRDLTAYLLNSLGEVARSCGDYDRAADCYGSSLALFRELGSRAGVAVALQNLGRTAQRRDDVQCAAQCFAEALTICRELGNTHLLASCWAGLGTLAVTLGQVGPGVMLMAAAGLLAGERLDPEDRRDVDAALRLADRAMGSAAREVAWQEGRSMTPDQANACAAQVLAAHASGRLEHPHL